MAAWPARRVVVVLLVVGALVPASALGGCSSGSLTRLTWSDETPSWTPNGREIVFASNRAHPKRATDQLYVMNADGSGVRRLTRGDLDAREPSFSPDGKWIVYAAHELRASGLATDAGAIDLISANGTKVRFLSPRLRDADFPTWSPDGRWIAFVNSLNPTANLNLPPPRDDLYVVRSDGGHLHRVATDVGAYAWSPNSPEIAFEGANGDVYGESAGATAPVGKPLGVGHGAITDIAWSPDGSKIAFASGREVGTSIPDINPRYLWILDLRRREERRLRPLTDSLSVEGPGGPYASVTITWLRGQTPTLAVFNGDNTDLLGIGEGSQHSIKTPSKGFLSAGGASPDGKKLLLVVQRSNSSDSAIFVGSVDGGRAHQLTQRG
jgi:Tol biopolymer transport system component